MSDYDNLEEQYEEEFSEPPEVAEEQPEMSKPKPLERKYVLGRKTSRPTIVSSGVHVDYVNSVFGILGDEFTEETEDAVRAYQRGKGLKETGRVDMATYSVL